MTKNLFGSSDISLSLFGNSSSRSCPPKLKTRLRIKYWKDKYAGPCFCCGKPCNWNDPIHIGRIKAGGKYTIKNARIICAKCNLRMRRSNMKTYMKQNYPKRYEKSDIKSESSTVRKPRTGSKPKPKDILGFSQGKVSLGV